jgi:hypothetical protein
MKKLIFTLFSLFLLFEYCNSQTATQSLSPSTSSLIGAPKEDKTNDKDQQKSFLKQISTFSISGLGSTQLTTDPSANLNAQINICPLKNKQMNLLLNYNLGSSQDTTNLKSLSLSRIFYPDNSSMGFTCGIGLDILPYITGAGSLRAIKFGVGNEGKDYNYYSITPAIDYLYRKINISDLNIDSLVPRIETSSFYFGIECAGHWQIGNNLFNISVTPYTRIQRVTQGTDSTYQYIFKQNNGGKYVSRSITSFGINASAQLGKIQLSFVYDYISPTVIKDPNITGGTFLVKVSVIGDFLNFNFEPKEPSIPEGKK